MNWISAFGRDHVSVRLYEDLRGSIVQDMLRAAKLDDAAEAIAGDDPKRHNASLPLNTLETLRQVYLSLSGTLDDSGYRKLVHNRLLPAVRIEDDQPRGCIWSVEELAQLRKSTLGPMQFINDEICPLSECYFTPPDLPLVTPVPDSQEVDRLRRLLDHDN